MPLMLNQKQSQASTGGMSDLYLSSGTYVKTFYTILAVPSCVRVGVVHDSRGNSPGMHHDIDWPKAVPKILHERHKRHDTATDKGDRPLA